LHTGQSLSVTDVDFKHNQVIGNEEVLLPGNGAAGGAIAILSGVPGGSENPVATIEDSRFTHNDAMGTNSGTFGSAFGGAINHQGHLTITGSTLTHNGAFGGDVNTGGSGAFVGLAFGGAINNNSGGTLTMDDSVVTHNRRKVPLIVCDDLNTGQHFGLCSPPDFLTSITRFTASRTLLSASRASAAILSWKFYPSSSVV
jgi:hypothetical protein